MSDSAERRGMVLAALADCPQERWVHFEDLSRYFGAAGYDFEISRNLWTLYIGEQRYGALGYTGFGEWHILQDRYMLAVLMEYAATLGAIDIAYELPEGAREDFDNLWGVDDLAFLSLYDGLRYFRVNALGA